MNLSRRALLAGVIAAPLTGKDSTGLSPISMPSEDSTYVGIDLGGPDTMQVVWVYDNRIIYCYDRGSIEWVNVGAPDDFAMAT